MRRQVFGPQTPACDTGAMDNVIASVESTGGPYDLVACDPDLADTAAFCEAYGYAAEDSANAILVVGKSDARPMACCLVLANTRLDVNGVVRKRLGTRKASFASAEETVDRSGGMQIGGVTPFGLPPDLPIWIDERVMARSQVIVGGGSREQKILCPPTTIAALETAEVVPDLAKEHPAA